MSVTLVLGGARSGKSRVAEGLVKPPRVYIATAQAFDSEMSARIATHQARRGVEWTTVEAPLDLAGALEALEPQGAAVLVDCLTLWLSNLMLAEKEPEAEIERLAQALEKTRLPVVLVSNELGLGIVPEHALARRFRDHHGLMNQRMAALAGKVIFTVASIATVIKG